jgi:ligand-binding sensor domain-containing protein
VSEFDGTTWTTYTTADGLAYNDVHAIASDGADHIWVGTSAGVSEFFHGYVVWLPLTLRAHH